MDAITQDSTATKGQMTLIHRFASDALGRAVSASILSKREAQCVIEHGDEFTAAIRKCVGHLLTEHSTIEKFKSEEMDSRHTYGERYAPKELAEQCAELQALFPEVKPGGLPWMALPLPSFAEAWFVIPKWQAIASSYQEAVEAVFTLLNTRFHGFKNHCDRTLGRGQVRQSAMKLSALERMLAGGDVYLVPAQFGMRHRGRSVRRAHELLAHHEFPLGCYEVGIMLLLHPERLTCASDLWVECSGDEYHLSGSEQHFTHTPYFYNSRGALEFGVHEPFEVRRMSGVASGFGR